MRGVNAKIKKGWLIIQSDVEFKSDFALDESVERLSKATKTIYKEFIRPEFFKSVLIGHVWKIEVALRRQRPFIHWIGEPYFIGQFEEKEGQVFLKGDYRMTVTQAVIYYIQSTLALILAVGLLLGGLVGFSGKTNDRIRGLHCF